MFPSLGETHLYVFEGSLCRGFGIVKEFEGVVPGARGQDLLGGVEGQAGDLVHVVVQRPDDGVVLHVLLRRLVHHHLQMNANGMDFF